jgi:hypothetical protein
VNRIRCTVRENDHEIQSFGRLVEYAHKGLLLDLNDLNLAIEKQTLVSNNDVT